MVDPFQVLVLTVKPATKEKELKERIEA